MHRVFLPSTGFAPYAASNMELEFGTMNCHRIFPGEYTSFSHGCFKFLFMEVTFVPGVGLECPEIERRVPH